MKLTLKEEERLIIFNIAEIARQQMVQRAEIKLCRS